MSSTEYGYIQNSDNIEIGQKSNFNFIPRSFQAGFGTESQGLSVLRLLYPRVTESARTTRGFVEFGDGEERRVRHGEEEHLCNAVPAANRERLAPVVD